MGKHQGAHREKVSGPVKAREESKERNTAVRIPVQDWQ